MKILITGFMGVLLIGSTNSSASENEDDAILAAHYTDRVFSATSILLVNPKVEEQLTEIVNGLSENKPYQVRIINDALVNAFSPGPGYIYVTSGLLDTVDSIDELAFVLGHELAHGELDHAGKNRRQGATAGFIGKMLFEAGQAYAGVQWSLYDYGYSGSVIAANFGAALADTYQVSAISGFSKSLELEADAASIRYMYHSGHDLAAAEQFALKMMGYRDRFGLEENDTLTLHLLDAQPGLDERLEGIRNERAKFEIDP